MKLVLVAVLATSLAGCSVERIGAPGVTLTRVVPVKARDVQVFENAAAVPGAYTIVETVWVKDTDEDSPRAMRDRLRVIAGARGANAVILAASNREDNKLRVDLRPSFDDPFEYYQGTAIWLGEGEPPVKYLGTLGGAKPGS